MGDARTEYHRYEAAGGAIGELWVRNGILLVHELTLTTRALEPDSHDGSTHRTRAPKRGASTPEVTVSRKVLRDRADFVPDLCRRFQAHLRGERVVYDDVHLDLDGLTPLQQEMATALRRVPWGEIVSYGELAALAGSTGAARAAGSFCASSSWSLVVPAHRVVAADGIGGYGASGVQHKRRLLALEGVRL